MTAGARTEGPWSTRLPTRLQGLSQTYLWAVPTGEGQAEGPWSTNPGHQRASRGSPQTYLFFGLFQRGRVKQRAPGVRSRTPTRLQGLSSNASPSKTSQTDPALAPCISLSIAGSCVPDNAPSSVCPVHHSQAYTLSNAAAYADGLETEA